MHLQAGDVVQPMCNSVMQVLSLRKVREVWTPCTMIQRKSVVTDVKYGNMLHQWELKTGKLALLKFKDGVESRSVLEENKEETRKNRRKKFLIFNPSSLFGPVSVRQQTPVR